MLATVEKYYTTLEYHSNTKKVLIIKTETLKHFGDPGTFWQLTTLEILINTRKVWKLQHENILVKLIDYDNPKTLKHSFNTRTVWQLNTSILDHYDNRQHLKFFATLKQHDNRQHYRRIGNNETIGLLTPLVHRNTGPDWQQ